MTLQYLLDTDTCVYWLRGKTAVRDRVNAVGPTVLAISIVTLAELRYGAACSAKPTENQQAIDVFAAALSIIGIDALIAQRFGDIKAVLRQQGQLLEDSDLFIAATALSLGFTLVTNNTAHFQRIAGLRLERWN
jgi:tRNA(fMet)-specific endonuclease VapC